MKETEYREGEVVRKEFERTMTALFRAPKPKVRKQAKKSASVHKSKQIDKD